MFPTGFFGIVHYLFLQFTLLPPIFNPWQPGVDSGKLAGMKLTLLLAALCLPCDAQATARTPRVTLTGKVVGVTDGDTLTLLEGKTQYKIRLAEIDAPESRQPFGSRAKQALSDKVFGKTVRVQSARQDRYGRTLGTVEVDGRNVNLELVREGMAWHYKHFSKSKTFAAAEQEARKAKAGLWADQDPVPPWEWRKQKRNLKMGNLETLANLRKIAATS